MRDWTPSARDELERALAVHHARMVGTGVDADEVVADLRRHVETELGTRDAAPVDVEAVRTILRRVIDDLATEGVSGAGAEVPAASAKGTPRVDQHASRGAADPVRAKTSRMRRVALHWVFLVVLPAITLGFELTTGMCATELFDPIAGVAQILAVAAVPLVFGSILVVHHRPQWHARLPWLRAAAAIATGICAYYAVQFAPLVPVAGIAIIFFGLGLLPLAPLLAFGVSLDVLAQLRRLEPSGSPGRPPRAVWPLVFAGALALVAADLSSICASLGMRWYDSADPAVQARGIALLRSGWVDPDDIDHPWRMGGLASGTSAILGWITGNDGRIFGSDFDRMQFAATGAPRNLADPNLWRRTRGRGRAGDARWSVLGNLALGGSRLDGSIDPELLYGYVEWTMTLHNSERWPLEGRATLQLPPGGVVSRVTLWIEGEEREAAFAGRAAATKAYESVAIVQRRDPILVTTAGPDRVRLRCFPVPASGDMKFRLGITFPLRATADGAGADVGLPSVIESNFVIPGTLQHHLWIGRAGTDGSRVDDVDTVRLRGPVGRDALRDIRLKVRRDASVQRVSARGFDETGVIVQQMRPAAVVNRRIILVVDGNPRVLSLCTEALAGGVSGLGPVGTELWWALDQPVHRSFATPETALAHLVAAVDSGEISDDAGDAVGIPRRGGFDNSPALVAALTEGARVAGGGIVLWIHGPQLGGAGSADGVRQVLERSGGRVRLVAISAVPGRNDLLDALDGRPEVSGAGSLTAGSLGDEMMRHFGSAPVAVSRALAAATSVSDGEAVSATRHLARLWAAGEAMRLIARGPGHQAEAIALAVRHQIVTPVSGAVVLETQQQYDAHGLRPVDPVSVPSVPETGSVLVVLLAAVSLMAAGAIRYHRNKRVAS